MIWKLVILKYTTSYIISFVLYVYVFDDSFGMFDLWTSIKSSPYTSLRNISNRILFFIVFLLPFRFVFFILLCKSHSIDFSDFSSESFQLWYIFICNQFVIHWFFISFPVSFFPYSSFAPSISSFSSSLLCRGTCWCCLEMIAKKIYIICSKKNKNEQNQQGFPCYKNISYTIFLINQVQSSLTSLKIFGRKRSFLVDAVIVADFYLYW